MPFVNIKTPEGALNRAQKEEIMHRATDMLVEYFSEAARPHTMVLIEEVKDGGYGRADDSFLVPEAYRAWESSQPQRSAPAPRKGGGRDFLCLGAHQTTGWVSPVPTLTKPSGASGLGATSTQVQGEQVSVANISRSGKPGYQRGRKVGSYIQSTFSAAA